MLVKTGFFLFQKSRGCKVVLFDHKDYWYVQTQNWFEYDIKIGKWLSLEVKMLF